MKEAFPDQIETSARRPPLASDPVVTELFPAPSSDASPPRTRADRSWPFRLRRRYRKPSRPVSVGLALAQFGGAGVVALVLLAVIGVSTLRSAAVDHEVAQATQFVAARANLRFAPAVTDALVNGDPAAMALADRIAREQLLSDRVVRIKLWTRDGRIVYSDEPRLINQTFPLAAADLATLKVGKPNAGLSRLQDPENAYERSYGRLLQVYERVETPSGRPMLLELYLRFDSVTANAQALGRAVAPAFLLALLALEILQLPLAWRLARRIGAGHREREALNRRALEASDHERRRIARDLHDGVVQSLAGVSYALTAVGAELRRLADAGVDGGSFAGPDRGAVAGPDRGAVAGLAGAVTEAARSTRQNIAELRSLIFDINPPSLHQLGLPAAVRELAASLTEAGIEVTVEAPAFVTVPPERAGALYRAAQEGVRNIINHSHASTAKITIEQRAGLVRLTIVDDGIGFGVADGVPAAGREHFGLTLLDDLATDSGGRMTIQSAPGRGTTLQFGLPLT